MIFTVCMFVCVLCVSVFSKSAGFIGLYILQFLDVSSLRPPHPYLGDMRNSTLSKSDPVFTNLPPAQVNFVASTRIIY